MGQEGSGKLSGRGSTELNFEGYVGNRQVKGSQRQWDQKRNTETEERQERQRNTANCRAKEKAMEKEAEKS